MAPYIISSELLREGYLKHGRCQHLPPNPSLPGHHYQCLNPAIHGYCQCIIHHDKVSPAHKSTEKFCPHVESLTICETCETFALNNGIFQSIRSSKRHQSREQQANRRTLRSSQANARFKLWQRDVSGRAGRSFGTCSQGLEEVCCELRCRNKM